MGAVVDRDTGVTPEAAVLWARTTIPSSLLNLLIPASAEVADEYLNNPFQDSDGNNLAIPSAITLGRLEWIKTMHERRPSGATAVRTGDWSQRFQAGETPDIPESVLRYWQQYRLHPRKA